MTLRIGLGTRIGLGMRGSPAWLPTNEGQLALWLDASMGVSIHSSDKISTWADQSVVPTALSLPDTTGWTPITCSVSGTDINDGATTGFHYIQYAWTGSLVGGRTATIAVELKAGTKGFARVQWGSVPGGPGAVFAYVNLSTGAVGSKGGGVQSAVTESMGSGWWKLTMNCGPGNATTVYVVCADYDSGIGAGGAGDNTDISYTGTSAVAIQMRNYTATQSKNFTQTDSTYMCSAPVPWQGKLAIPFTSNGTNGTGFFGPAGAFKPLTEAHLFVAAQMDVDPGSAASGYNAAHQRWTTDGTLTHPHWPFADGAIYENFGTDTRHNGIAPVVSMAAPRIYEVRSVAGEHKVLIDGVVRATRGTNTVAFPATSPIIGGGAVDRVGADMKIGAWIVFSAGLTDEKARTVRRYLGKRFGISVI